MYKLVHTHTKLNLSQNSHALSYATHTFYVSPQYQACSKSRERYHNSFNPQENKTHTHTHTHTQKVFLKFFNVFGFFSKSFLTHIACIFGFVGEKP